MNSEVFEYWSTLPGATGPSGASYTATYTISDT